MNKFKLHYFRSVGKFFVFFENEIVKRGRNVALAYNVFGLGEEAELTAQKMKVAQMFNTPQQLHSSTSAAFLPNPCYMPCLSHNTNKNGRRSFKTINSRNGVESSFI